MPTWVFPRAEEFSTSEWLDLNRLMPTRYNYKRAFQVLTDRGYTASSLPSTFLLHGCWGQQHRGTRGYNVAIDKISPAHTIWRKTPANTGD